MCSYGKITRWRRNLSGTLITMITVVYIVRSISYSAQSTSEEYKLCSLIGRTIGVMSIDWLLSSNWFHMYQAD